MSGEYLERMSNEELLEFLKDQRKQLAKMNQAHNSDPKLVVLGGNESTLFNGVRVYITPRVIRKIEEMLEKRGVAIPVEQ